MVDEREVTTVVKQQRKNRFWKGGEAGQGQKEACMVKHGFPCPKRVLLDSRILC